MDSAQQYPGTRGPSGGAGRLGAEAAERLAGLDDAPLEEHVRVYDELHRTLAAALADPAPDVDGPRPPVPGPPGPGA